jgi:hypothetical protein
MVRQLWEVDYYAEILDLRQENQRLRGLLDFLRPELCVDCYQILYDYEHPEEEEVDDG